MATTTKYDFEKHTYSTTELNSILDTNIEKLDDYVHTYIEGTAGEALSQYDAVYLKSDGKYWKAQADGTKQPCLGIAIEAASADATVRIQRIGDITNAGWSWSTVGGKVYLDASTAGDLTETAPSENAQVVGIVLSATELWLAGSISTPAYETGSADGELFFWDDSNGRLAHTETSEMVWDDTNKRLGIGTASPARTLEVINTSAPLRIGYDASNYGEFSVDSSGNVVFSVSGDYVRVPGQLSIGPIAPPANRDLHVYSDPPDVTSNTSVFVAAVQGRVYLSNIASGVVDSGYRMGFSAQSRLLDPDFLGTLASQYGLHVDHGHSGACGAGTITNSYGVYIATTQTGGATITNLYALYQEESDAPSYFAGKVGFGITSPNRKGEFLDATNPQARFTHTDGTHYGEIQVDGSGYMKIITSGGGYGIDVAPTAVQTGYTTPSNLTTDRTFDADSTTVAELADVLGTLIEDLKAKGIISA